MNPDGCNPQWLRITLLEREKTGIAGLHGESQVWYQAWSMRLIPHCTSDFAQGLFSTHCIHILLI